MSTAPPVVLHDVHWSDAARVARLEARLFPDDAWSEASWWSELAGRPRRHYVVLEVGGELAGYAGLDDGGEVADVMTMAVAPEHRGRGLGAVLLDALQHEARRRGVEHLVLEVRADNDPAIGLYTGRGFAEISRRRGYYRPGPVDAIVMRKTLTAEGDRDG